MKMLLCCLIILFLWLSLAHSLIDEYIAIEETIELKIQLLSSFLSRNRKRRDNYILSLRVNGLHALHRSNSSAYHLYPDLHETLTAIQPFIQNTGQIESVQVTLESPLRLRGSGSNGSGSGNGRETVVPKEQIILHANMIEVALLGSLDHSDLSTTRNVIKPPRYLKFSIVVRIEKTIPTVTEPISPFPLPMNQVATIEAQSKLTNLYNSNQIQSPITIHHETKRDQFIVKGEHRIEIIQQDTGSSIIAFYPDIDRLLKTIQFRFGSSREEEKISILHLTALYDDSKEYPFSGNFINSLNEFIITEQRHKDTDIA